MKKNKLRSGIAVIAAAALTLSAGSGLTASAESYRVIEDPFFPGVITYVYEDGHYTDIQEPVRYYEPAAPKRVNSAADAKKAGANAAELPIDAAHFPDAKFRAYLSEHFDWDGRGVLSNPESVTQIYVGYIGVASLKGIEYFTNLQDLHCDGNLLTSIDLSQNTKLTSLYISYNKLTSLDVSNNTNLDWLNCYGNKLTQLDVSNNTALRGLDCNDNNLTTLDVSNNTNLYWLNCVNNKLAQLDVSNNTALTDLQCFGNNFTSLDVSNNKALEYLNCGNDNLAELDVSNNTALERLSCFDSNIARLDLSNNTALKELNCNNNHNLTALDLSNNTALERLQCYRNNLTALDISNTALRYLDCEYNYFKSKSDIVGLDEEAIADCNYIEQYYEGFRYKGSSADVDWDKVQFPTEEQVFSYMRELRHTKVMAHEIRSLSWDYDDTLPNYTYVLTNCVGIPEKIVTDDGIVFVPGPSELTSTSGRNVEYTWSCREDESRLRSVYDDNYSPYSQFIAYEPGEYTFIYNITYTFGSRSKTYTKEYTITAVDKADHVHEYDEEYTNGWYTDNGGYNYDGHSRKCYCGYYVGGMIDGQPHEYESELAIVPYLDGSNLYYKHCKVCGYYKLTDAKNSKTLTDEATGTKITDIEGDAIPDGAQLNVDDVTDTEKVDLKNVSKVYDISLKSGGVEIQPNNDIAVTIPVPEKVNGEKAKVNRKEADGSFTDMNAVYNPQSKTLTFVTDHLSIYAITGGDVLLGDVNGDGKINNTDIILLGRSYMAGTGAQYLDIADMNSDKKINNTDIILLGRLYMSMTVQ